MNKRDFKEFMAFSNAYKLNECSVEVAALTWLVYRAMRLYNTSNPETVLATLYGGNFIIKNDDCLINGKHGTGYIVMYHFTGGFNTEPCETVIEALTEGEYLGKMSILKETISFIEDIDA